jgi:hypothetical protein
VAEAVGGRGTPAIVAKVPASKHTGGIDARPAEYEQRVIAFFDRALLEAKVNLRAREDGSGASK